MQPGFPEQGQDPYGQQPPHFDPIVPQYGQPADPYAQSQPASGSPYQLAAGAQPNAGYPPRYPASGYQVPGYGPAMGGPAGQNNNLLGLLSMIFGILSIPVGCCGFFGLVMSVPAIVLGVLGIRKANQGQATNKGMAVAGLCCGIAALVLGLTIAVLGIAVQLGNLRQ